MKINSMLVKNMSDEDVVAEVSDSEIEDIEERRTRLFRERADLNERLSLVEADYEAVEAERKTWIAETRIFLADEELEDTVIFESGAVAVFAPPQNVRVPAAICAAFAFRQSWPSGADFSEGSLNADGELDLVSDAADAEALWNS